MKNIILLPLALLSILFVGCDQESPNDKDLYPQTVYIVGATDKIVDRDLNIGDSPYDTVSISVGVSGSRSSNQDVTVTVGEIDTAITIYNKKMYLVQLLSIEKLRIVFILILLKV